MPGPLVPVTPSEPPKLAPIARADRRDFVFRLKRDHAEIFLRRQIVQDIAGRA